MKLKKTTDDAVMTPIGDESVSAIPERFSYEGSGLADAGNKKPGGIGATIALIAALLATAMLGLTFWLIYQNASLIENV